MIVTMNEIARNSFSIGYVQNFDFTETLRLIKELSDRNVCIYKATSLTRVSLDEESLISLQHELISRIPGCSSAFLSLVNNDDYMPPSLKVKICVNSRSAYECLFASVLHKGNDSFGVQLPILCVLSGFSMADNIHQALESTFGCIISSLYVQKHNACWLMAISINEIFRRNLITEFSVVYKVQGGMKISCNLPSGELHYFWRESVVSNSNKLMFNEVMSFIEKFTTFFEKTYGVKISWFRAISFFLNEISLSFENEIEIRSNIAPLIYCLLSYIESDLIPLS